MGLPASADGIGTDGGDVITGTAGPEVIVAGAGNDVIYGRNSKDTICGGPGDDTLVGGRNPADWSTRRRGDRLSGGTGDDRIVDRCGFTDQEEVSDDAVKGSPNDLNHPSRRFRMRHLDAR